LPCITFYFYRANVIIDVQIIIFQLQFFLGKEQFNYLSAELQMGKYLGQNIIFIAGGIAEL